MGDGTKVLVTVLMVGAVGGIFALQNNNTSLKGEIKLQNTDKQATTAPTLPDLKVDLQVVTPESGSKDIKANVTITNLGPGAINGQDHFKYSIYVGDTEVFSNNDTYSTMPAGDSFNFVYPISQAIYNYPDKGTVKVVVDTTNSIKEGNENNNEAKVDYQLK